MRTAGGLAFWIVISFAAAAVGSMFTDPAWYESLQRPDWAPPSSVFGPVWTVLYLLMGIAAWLVWRGAGFGGARTALTLFLAQLVLNAAWSWFFFGLRRAGWGFADIVLLWILILATILAFRKHSKAAALLMVPYLLWVTYAAALNWSLWRMGA